MRSRIEIVSRPSFRRGRSGRTHRVRRSAGALLATALLTAAPLAGWSAAAGERDERRQDDVKRDLFGVIAIEGLPCGEVVEAERLAENDYLATCRTGDRYRVRVTPEGRVTVEPR